MQITKTSPQRLTKNLSTYAGFSSLNESSDSDHHDFDQHDFDQPFHEVNGSKEFDRNIRIFEDFSNPLKTIDCNEWSLRTSTRWAVQF